MNKLILMLIMFVGCGHDGAQGPQGARGEKGDSGQTLVAEPFCPSVGGGLGFQESYIIFPDGLYALYFDHAHAFLTKLTPGNYCTTDGRNCCFTVEGNNTVSYER